MSFNARPYTVQHKCVSPAPLVSPRQESNNSASSRLGPPYALYNPRTTIPNSVLHVSGSLQANTSTCAPRGYPEKVVPPNCSTPTRPRDHQFVPRFPRTPRWSVELPVASPGKSYMSTSPTVPSFASPTVPNLQTKLVEDNTKWQQFYLEFQTYKQEQATLVERLKSGFEMRIMSLEASVATTANLLASLTTKVNDRPEDSTCTSQCSTKAFDTSSSENCIKATTHHDVPVDRSHSSVEQFSSNASFSQLNPGNLDDNCRDGKLFVENCGRLARAMIYSPSVQDIGTRPRCDSSFERLSNVLAEMSSSWLAGNRCGVHIEPGLRERMEVVCDDLQRAILVERRECSSNGSDSNNVAMQHPQTVVEKHGFTSTAIQPELPNAMQQQASCFVEGILGAKSENYSDVENCP